MEISMVGFFLFFFVVTPLVFMTFTAYRNERKKADKELQTLLKELLEKKTDK